MHWRYTKGITAAGGVLLCWSLIFVKKLKKLKKIKKFQYPSKEMGSEGRS